MKSHPENHSSWWEKCLEWKWTHRGASTEWNVSSWTREGERGEAKMKELWGNSAKEDTYKSWKRSRQIVGRMGDVISDNLPLLLGGDWGGVVGEWKVFWTRNEEGMDLKLELLDHQDKVGIFSSENSLSSSGAWILRIQEGRCRLAWTGAERGRKGGECYRHVEGITSLVLEESSKMANNSRGRSADGASSR